MTEGQAVEWRPLNVRDTPEASSYDALVDGIPDWLERSLWRWLMDRAAQGSIPLIYKSERLLKIQLHIEKADANPQLLLDSYWTQSTDADRLTLLDFLLRDLQDQFNAAKSGTRPRNDHLIELFEAMKRLDDMLTEGGSLWTTTLKPHWGLVRRVNSTTQRHADLASSPTTDAARKIASAWNACYKHDPDYNLAYDEAVLAVEATSIPLTLPRSPRATLGSVVSHIANTVDNWTVAGLDAPQQASGETLLAMLRTLWHNQQRHANTDGTVGDVSQAEAEVAVSVAVTLVHWFSSGLVRRLDS